jgi:hypothetical protein
VSFLIVLRTANMKNMKTCDYRPLLLSNRLPEMYLTTLSRTLRDSVAGPGLRSTLIRDLIRV